MQSQIAVITRITRNRMADKGLIDLILSPNPALPLELSADKIRGAHLETWHKPVIGNSLVWKKHSGDETSSFIAMAELEDRKIQLVLLSAALL